MRNRYKKRKIRNGSALIMVFIAMVILGALGIGLMSVSYGVRYRAIMLKNEMIAMLAAEAGYEKALFWMSQQQDMLSALQSGASGSSGTFEIPDGESEYSVEFFGFVGARPVYKITATGGSGKFSRTVEVLVLQALSGWDMGMCRVPTGPSSTSAVNYAAGEIINMPIHINKLSDSPDDKDIYITGNPRFMREVAMGESRYRANDTDKYVGVMSCFEGGIYFNQPDSKITNESSIQAKINRFRDSTDESYRFTPSVSTSVTPRYPAVQLEFFVDPYDGEGKVRITNNCTVQAGTGGSYDYEIVPGSGGTSYRQYNIYNYHYKPTSETSVVAPLEDTYVSQSIEGVSSEPGGQIYVKGNVVIGSDDYDAMVVKGKMTIVAARADDGTGGNIWIADSLVVDGDRDANTGLPEPDNPNVVGLVAQGVIKVINPMDGPTSSPSGLIYEPIGIKKNPGDADNIRYLPDPLIIEAAVTVGGGGFGAEKVGNGPSGRREYSGIQDDLIVRGTIAEAVRGAVGLVSAEGFIKKYYLDSRLLEGVLPGDMWLRGKYMPAPAGWKDYRPD
ncbi:MAG: hypothetical protein JW947_03875 [Sedimentisphaerales bacterium]|nr:hypothetical protein [Sedimentisphaerales bacterium]